MTTRLPTSDPRRQPYRRAIGGRARLGLATVAAVVALAVGPGAGAALAHDALESSDPADGATLATPPTQVVLTFGADQLALGTAVAVVGPDGADHSEGAPTVAGAVVTQPVAADAPAGDYVVQWRSVSGDGHPVTGELTFTATAPGQTATEPAPGPAATTEPSATTQPTAAAEGAETAPAASQTPAAPGDDGAAQDAASGAPSSLGPTALTVAVVVIVGLGATALVLRRRGALR